MACLISLKSHCLGVAPSCEVNDSPSFGVGCVLLFGVGMAPLFEVDVAPSCVVFGAPLCVVGDGSGIDAVVLLGLTVEVQ